MQHRQPPILVVHNGDGMSADSVAWELIAEAAKVGLKLPGLSPASRQDLTEVWAGARLAAGLPSESHPPRAGVQLPA